MSLLPVCRQVVPECWCHQVLPEIMWVAIGAGVPGQCSATGCIDLSKYPFMNSNSCICNSPALGQIANSAGSAARHYMRAAIGEAPAQYTLSAARETPEHHYSSAVALPKGVLHAHKCLTEVQALTGGQEQVLLGSI